MPESTSSCRRDIRLSYLNALLWALGNGLVSTTLVIYLALGMGASGTAIAWLVAAPRFAGVLRIASPAMLARVSRLGLGRKAICLGGFTLSALALVAIPLVASRSADGVSKRGVALLTTAWCVYHLLEYLGGVAFWSWLGDLYPDRLRGRLLGGRERWLTLGRACGLGASITLAAGWAVLLPDAARWVPLAASATVGAGLMLLSVAPLAGMTPLALRPSARPRAPWRTMRRAWSQRPYRRLLTYSGWIGFANGLASSAQGMYPGRVLGIGYHQLQSLVLVMWLGQSAIAPTSGRVIQRRGAKRIMLLSQAIVAAGGLGFLIAHPGAPWWIALAYASWIAWTPINVGLDTLKIGLAERDNNGPYLAVHLAFGDLCGGVAILIGGLLYDTLAAGDAHSLEVYGWLFVASGVGRFLGIPLIARLIEPTPAPGAKLEGCPPPATS